MTDSYEEYNEEYESQEQQLYYEEDSKEPDYGKRTKMTRNMHIAVTGCSHGEMDRIYETLTQIKQKRNLKIDLLICCGDFQAIRNYNDLKHLNVPPKYRQLMTFNKYYSGEKVAPVLTIFVGGNHESSGFLAEMPNGGWAAPNIYYMGHAGVVRIGGLRIAGLSGIFKAKDYDRGHFERPPFNPETLRSVYHVRSVDIFRLKQLKSRDDDGPRVDVVVSHDWPAGITDFGDVEKLLKVKPYFRNDIDNNQLGNPATMDLLHDLKPRRWFSAHMHVKFEAEVPHHDKDGSTTKFLALDKPLLRRQFLEILEVPLNEEQQRVWDAEEGHLQLHYDPEWLAILKSTDFLTEVTDKRVYMPGRTSERFDFRPSRAEVDHVRALFNEDFRIPLDFRQTAPPLHAAGTSNRESAYYRNPHSTEFSQRLGIRDLNELLCQRMPQFVAIPHCFEDTATAKTSTRMIDDVMKSLLEHHDENPYEQQLHGYENRRLDGELDDYADAPPHLSMVERTVVVVDGDCEQGAPLRTYSGMVSTSSTAPLNYCCAEDEPCKLENPEEIDIDSVLVDDEAQTEDMPKITTRASLKRRIVSVADKSLKSVNLLPKKKEELSNDEFFIMDPTPQKNKNDKIL